jgi:hypothetical protein
MARIDGLTPQRASWWQRLGFWYARRRLGKIPEPMAVSAHQPWIYGGYAAFELALDRSRRAPAKLKALAALKSSALVGCPF